MVLERGARIGPYEILDPLGAGGMGEVYRARDTRLERTVAIKVLPEDLSNRPEARERFEREARAVSQLNHPHICTLYDVGRQETARGVIDFLVMEYLDGETLAERLARGPLPLDQTLKYATEIADALDAAHRQGVTHRDLKPANVMLTRSGSTLLDFGLAKWRHGESKAVAAAESALPTEAKPLTVEGAILGTFQYMAPEQLEGKDADPRTDLFAFGAVLYEMTTGRKAFEGRSQASLISAIMTAEPPSMSGLQPLVPPSLERVVRRCLAKPPEERWQTAKDLGEELRWIAGGSDRVAAGPVTARSPSTWRFGPMGMAATAALGVALGWGVTWRLSVRPAERHPVTRFSIAMPVFSGAGLVTVGRNSPRLALSLDGKRLVFRVPTSGGVNSLYVREMDQIDARPIPGTDLATQPFFSPDGQWVGFSAGTNLMKVSLAGGPPQLICEAAFQNGAWWDEDDTIVFSSAGGLMRVPAAGGNPQPVTTLEKDEGAHLWPQVLPGGKEILFTSQKTGLSIAVHSLETGKRRVVVDSGRNARYLPTGHLVYSTLEGSLVAVPFDPRRFEVTGSPVTVAGDVELSAPGVPGPAQFAVSDTGTLAYYHGVAPESNSLAWVDRRGGMRQLPAPPHLFEQPRLSPDGSKLAIANREGNPDVWVYDLDRSTLTRLTFDAVEEETPVWTPDGKHVTFRRTLAQILRKSADGSGVEEKMADLERSTAHVGSWAPDGRVLALYARSAADDDVWILPQDGAKPPEPFQFLRSPFNERAPMFSPDGRLLAYTSDESGRDEVYVTSFPGPGGKWQVSTESGIEPMWARSGRELFYIQRDTLMSVTVETRPGFSAGSPRPVLELQGRYMRGHRFYPNYDVSADGERFLMVFQEQPSVAPPIHIVLNALSEIASRAPGK